MKLPPFALFAILCVGILTIWVPGSWAAGACQFAIFLLAAARREGPKTWFPVILLALVPAIGLLQWWTGTTSYAFATLTHTLEWTAMVCVLGVTAAMEPHEARTFRAYLLWFAFLLATVALVQYFTAGGRIFWVFDSMPGGVGPFPNRNHWAVFIELMLPVAIWELIRSKTRTLLYAVMIGVMYASVIASASRAGVALCTLALVAVPMAGLGRGFAAGHLVKVVLAVLGVAGGFAWIAGPEAVWQRWQETDIYQVRQMLLASSVAMFRLHPWTGFGIGTWPAVYPQFALIDPGARANEAHNDWAQWAVEGGVPLLAIMAALAAWITLRAYRHPWALGLVLVLIHACVEYPFQRQALALWFAALLGLLTAIAACTRARE